MTAPAGVNKGSGTESAQVEAAEPESAEAGGPIAEDSREQSQEAAAEPEAAAPDAAAPDAVELEATPAEMAGTEMAGTPAERDMSPLAVVGVIVCVIALVGVAAGVLILATHGFHKKTVVTVKHKAAAVFSLRPGLAADVVITDEAFRLRAVMRHGRWLTVSR